MAGPDDPEAGPDVAITMESPLRRQSWAMHRPPATPGGEDSGADRDTAAAPSESTMRRVSRRNSSVLIIRPAPATATNREAEFGGGIATATARLVPTDERPPSEANSLYDTASEGELRSPLLLNGRKDSGAIEVTAEWADDGDEDSGDAQLAWAVNLSLAGNILLLLVKLYAFLASRSFAVLASLADSGVDLASQIVLFFCNRRIAKLDPRYPVGRTRMETVGVILCAVIMALSSTEVVQTSAGTLWQAFRTGVLPEIGMGWMMYSILGGATLVKAFLYVLCKALAKRSATALALAEDHRNDIMSNAVAIVTAAVATEFRKVWWVDPVGAILISCYIVYTWIGIASEQMDLMVGLGAPTDFVEFLTQLAGVHDEKLRLDEVRAYHFGARYIVEMEVILPASMTVKESHDIALRLQHKVEALDEVERAFVHVDYKQRDEPEHKVERNLQQGARNLFTAHDSVRHQVPKYTPFEQANNLASEADLRTVASAPAAAQGSPDLEDQRQQQRADSAS